MYIFTCSESPTCDMIAGTPSCGSVTLDAGASDPDCNLVSVDWSSADCPAAVITPDGTDPNVAAVDVDPACQTCLFDVLVTYATGATCAGSVAVTFTDTDPPSIASGSDAYCLWPPDHRYACFVAADFHPAVSDTCASGVTWRFVGCASDQATKWHGRRQHGRRLHHLARRPAVLREGGARWRQRRGSHVHDPHRGRGRLRQRRPGRRRRGARAA